MQYDPLIVNEDGSLISDNSSYPVEDAITEYLYSIEYGGVFNKTKLVDAVQRAIGVTDVILESVQVKPHTEDDYTYVSGNNYESVGGAFAPEDLRSGIEYVLQI